MFSLAPGWLRSQTERLADIWTHVSAALTLGDISLAHVPQPETKILNGVLVGTGILIAFLTSWYVISVASMHVFVKRGVLFRIIYRSMQAHIRHIEDLPSDVDELAAEAVDEAAEGAPLLGNYSSESVQADEESVNTVRPKRTRSTSST